MPRTRFGFIEGVSATGTPHATLVEAHRTDPTLITSTVTGAAKSEHGAVKRHAAVTYNAAQCRALAQVYTDAADYLEAGI